MSKIFFNIKCSRTSFTDVEGTFNNKIIYGINLYKNSIVVIASAECIEYGEDVGGVSRRKCESSFSEWIIEE
jgi:hypothetical protein